jgi:hypothetical protein
MPSYTAQSREAGRAPVEMGSRTDAWWKEAMPFAVIFLSFVVYTTYRMFDNQYFMYPWHNGPSFDQVHAASYLSPLYSPYIPFTFNVPLPFFGTKSFSPAIYILIFPLSFRMTCYYYRKAYYRAFFRDPAACAVPEPNAKARMKYTGERAFPFIAQNFHRFALYAALLFMIMLTYDAIKGFVWHTPNGLRPGVGVGSIVLVINVLLLSAYTFGCHSFRHLVGGSVDCYSCDLVSRTRHGLWQKVSLLNKKHATWALWSMVWVGVTDVYINLVARHIITDFHIIF